MLSASPGICRRRICFASLQVPNPELPKRLVNTSSATNNIMGNSSADEDFDVDVDDMLLELVEDDGDRKRKRARPSSGSGSKSNGAKRRKEYVTHCLTCMTNHPTTLQERLSSIIMTYELSVALDRLTADSDDEAEPESEEDESNPYPLEGRYKNEADRQRLAKLLPAPDAHTLDGSLNAGDYFIRQADADV